MKNLIIAAFLAMVVVPSYANPNSTAVIKTVCHDKKDKAGKVIMGKDDKPVQVCKKIKVREKLQGTPIPEKK
jgi:hypothetical protein